MVNYPQIRIGIDWDNDGFICVGASTIDALNLIPYPLSLDALDKLQVGNVLLTNILNITDYGIIEFEHLFGGYKLENVDFSHTVYNAEVHLQERTVSGYGSDVTTISCFASWGSTYTNLFDNNLGTYHTNTGTTVGNEYWFVTDFGSNYNITRVRYYPFSISYNINPIYIEFSNDLLTWDTLYTGTVDWTLVSTYIDFDFENEKTYRYLRIRGLAEYTAWRTYEVEALPPIYTSNQKIAQGLVPTSTGYFLSAGLMLRKEGLPAGDLTLKLYSDTAGSPDTPLATSSTTISSKDLTSDFVMQDFEFTPVAVTASTQYWLVLETTDSYSPVNYIAYKLEQGVTTSGFTTGRYDGTSWTMGGYQGFYSTVFKRSAANDELVYGADGSSIIDDIPVNSSTQYTLSCWIKGIEDYNGLDYKFLVYDQSPAVVATGSNFNITGEYVKYSITFTSSVGQTHLAFSIRQVSNSTSKINITGWMLVEGIETGQGFNTGTPVSIYESIDNPLQANWKSGWGSPGAKVANEGTATLILDNNTRLYSPEYSSSPLYGYMLDNRLVTIDIYNEITLKWVRVWSGWTTTYDPAPGKNKLGEAVINCEQGIFRFNSVFPIKPVYEETMADILLTDLINAGWYAAGYPYTIVLDKSYIGVNTFITLPEDGAEIDTGNILYAYPGEGWSSSSSGAMSIIKELMQVEQGYFWLDRHGKLHFYNHDKYHINDTPDFTISIDTQANDGTYQYGAEIVNSISVSYSPKKVLTGILWSNKETIELAAKSTKTIIAKFEFEEGSKRTVTAVNSVTASSNPSTISVLTKAGVDVADYVEFTITEKTNEVELTLNNVLTVPVYIEIVLKGSYLDISNNQIEEVINTSSIQLHGLYKDSFSSKLISDSDTAKDLANYILAEQSNARGIFTKVKIMSRDINWLNNILSYDLGNVVEISEYQTGATIKSLIVGQEMDWQPGLLTSNIILGYIPRSDYWLLNVSSLDNGTVLGY